MQKGLLFISLVIIFTFNLQAQNKLKAVNNSEIELKKVQDLYFKRDFVGASELAQKVLEKNPADSRLKAWYVMSLARSDNGQSSLEIAESFISESGENLWTLLALNFGSNLS